MNLCSYLRCCLEEMWNMVSARVKSTAAAPGATAAAAPAKGKKKTAAPSAALMVAGNNQGSGIVQIIF